MRLFSVVTGFVFFVGLACAQSEEALPFHSGEELSYDISYKYGLVMLKAGTIRFCIKESAYEGVPACKSSIYFKTTSFFDKIFKIRDTLNAYIAVPTLAPLFHDRSVNEGNTHFTEELFVKKFTPDYSEVFIERKKNNELNMDTVLSANNLGFDLVSVFIYVRSVDYSNLKPGDNFKLTTFVGESKSNIVIRYQGQSVLERNNEVKYKALKLTVDVADRTFNETKNSMEVWLSDDGNKIPLKIKAKLKIGAAAADLVSYKNLKNPFDSEVWLSKRK